MKNGTMSTIKYAPMLLSTLFSQVKSAKYKGSFPQVKSTRYKGSFPQVQPASDTRHL